MNFLRFNTGQREFPHPGQDGKERTNHIMAQPSPSWKLRAISTPLLGSVHTIRVSAPHVRYHPRARVCVISLALLFLEAIFFANPSLKKEPIGLVFRFDYDAGLLGTTFRLTMGTEVSICTGKTKGVEYAGQSQQRNGRDHGQLRAREGPIGECLDKVDYVPGHRQLCRILCLGQTSHCCEARRPSPASYPSSTDEAPAVPSSKAQSPPQI